MARDLSQFPAAMNISHFLDALPIYGLTITPGKVVGWLGAGIFGLRFLIQWIASERAKKSVIPFGFWECSALGSLLALSYFAVYRHDSVGVLQNLLPLPIYLRNLYFRYARHEPKHAGAKPRVEE